MKKVLFLISCLWISSCLTYCSDPQKVNIYIAKYKGDKTCAISYTFDDGMKEHFTIAAPKLEASGFRGTFWINGSTVNGDVVADTAKLSWAELREMQGNGHEVSNHTWSHQKLTKISLEEARVEIVKNDSIIFANIGVYPRTFCYPYNSHNRDILQMASENRVGTRTEQFAIGTKTTADDLSRRVNDLLESKGWGVAMLHGINYGYDALPDPAVFWEHLRKVKEQDDRIWVGTFREIAAYSQERDQIKLKVNEKKKRLEVVPELSLDKKIFTQPLTAVVEKEGMNRITVKQGKMKLDVRLMQGKAIFDFDPYGGTVQIVID